MITIFLGGKNSHSTKTVKISLNEEIAEKKYNFTP